MPDEFAQYKRAPQDEEDEFAQYKRAPAAVVTPPPAEQPGALKRFGQSLGLPTSKEELEAARKEALVNSIPGVLPGKMLYNYGKTAFRGQKEGLH